MSYGDMYAFVSLSPNSCRILLSFKRKSKRVTGSPTTPPKKNDVSRCKMQIQRDSHYSVPHVWCMWKTGTRQNTVRILRRNAISVSLIYVGLDRRETMVLCFKLQKTPHAHNHIAQDICDVPYLQRIRTSGPRRNVHGFGMLYMLP